MMKKVPKRRFKGFLNAGDWEQRKLGDVVKRESVMELMIRLNSITMVFH